MGDFFFLISKAAWAVLRPDSILLLMLCAGIVALTWLNRPLFGKALLVFTLGLFVVCGLWPVQSLVLRPLEQRFPANPDLEQVAGIIQLGGSEDLAAQHISGMPQVNQAGDRYLATLALARRFPEARVIFAGGSAKLRTRGGEARVAETLLRAGGIAAERLTLENRSRNTHENAVNTRALVPETQGTWLLVTSAAHMPRALGTFCAAGWEGLVPYPVDHRTVPLGMGWNPAGHLFELHAALREWVGLVAYRATGRTRELFPGRC